MYQAFADRLYSWHDGIERELPWKESKDPYRIWVSEIILQQTRVAQGLPYYMRFIDRFPDVTSLARSPEDDLLSVWKGLGYYSRARNMHKAAQLIEKDFNGEMPTDYSSILSLPGVGPYTAAAISSFAYDQPFPVIDGNVKRVISRYFGITEPVDTSKGERQLKENLEKIFDSEDPARFNQAIMDFGALQCKPRSPECGICPFYSDCTARTEELTDQLPIKVKKLKRTKRFFHYFAVTIGDQMVLTKRKGNDIWKGLYEPLLHEGSSDEEIVKERQLEFLGSWMEFDDSMFIGEVTSKKQVLSHQDIHTVFYRYHFEDTSVELKKPVELVNLKNLSNFAVPKVVDWYLADFSIPLDN